MNQTMLATALLILLILR